MTNGARLKTALEASNALGISAETLRRWVRSGKLRYGVYRMRGTRYLRFDVRQLMRQLNEDQLARRRRF